MKKTVLFLSLFLTAPLSFAVGPGKSAPPFTLKAINGASVSLSELKGTPVIVNFWATWCPPCHVEFPKLNALAVDYKDKGVKILAISLDKSDSNIQSFLTKIKSIPVLTILRDSTMKTPDAFGVEAMPSTYILDKQGTIRFVHEGFRPADEAAWRKELDLVLAEAAK